MSNRTRADIRADFQKNKDKIKELEDANIELLKEGILLSDDERQYREEDGTLMEWHTPEGSKRRKRIAVPHRLGKIFWKETFYDQGTTPPSPVEIERQRLVKIDGEWFNDGRGFSI